MEAIDLRIGNLAQVSGVQYVVDTLSSLNNAILISRKGAILTTPLDEVEPIPLTPDELVKLGFVQDYSIWINGEFVLFKNTHENVIDLDKEFFYHTYYKFARHLKHVHQLQNLFYSLVGEELDVNF